MSHLQDPGAHPPTPQSLRIYCARHGLVLSHGSGRNYGSLYCFSHCTVGYSKPLASVLMGEVAFAGGAAALPLSGEGTWSSLHLAFCASFRSHRVLTALLLGSVPSLQSCPLPCLLVPGRRQSLVLASLVVLNPGISLTELGTSFLFVKYFSCCITCFNANSGLAQYCPGFMHLRSDRLILLLPCEASRVRRELPNLEGIEALSCCFQGCGNHCSVISRTPVWGMVIMHTAAFALAKKVTVSLPHWREGGTCLSVAPPAT